MDPYGSISVKDIEIPDIRCAAINIISSEGLTGQEPLNNDDLAHQVESRGSTLLSSPYKGPVGPEPKNRRGLQTKRQRTTTYT